MEMVDDAHIAELEMRELVWVHMRGHWGLEKMKWVCERNGWKVKEVTFGKLIQRCPTCQRFELPKNTQELREICGAHYPG